MTGTVISHYRLLTLLGEGGMGVVYRAEDLRLGREVAIKFLRAEVAASGQWLERFQREARLASSLQHPHICTIHELGEHDGQRFIVMELLEGRTIKRLIESGPLPIAQLLDYAIQIADALDAAHRRGIIHRDIKPANLFVAHGDRVKVLDFGLAKHTEDVRQAFVTTASTPTVETIVPPDITRTGIAVGTAAYMSPEQAMGEPLDPRTDLFSFGSVLYEMSAGRRAFPGDDPVLTRTKILNGIVIPLTTVDPSIPEELARIVERAMRVDRAQRYQGASEMLRDLRALALRFTIDAPAAELPTPAEPAAVQIPARRTPWRWIAAGVLGAILLTVLARWTFFDARPAALTDRDTLLVGAFENSTGDQVFDETLLTALKVQLAQSPFLDIVPDDRIRETLRSMGRPAGESMAHEVARHACQRLGAKAMLEGAVGTLGEHYVVTLTATDCQTGDTLARQQGTATAKERVLAALGELSKTMRTTLGESLPSIRQFDVPIEQATTPSLAALKAYTLGVAERRAGRELESVAFFNQAIEIDPEFAAAYTTLSAVYGSLGEWPRSEEFARLAFDRLKRVSERERFYITYQYHDRVTGDQEQAAKTLELWKLSYPRDSRPLNALALIHNRLGRYDRAVIEAERALERSPGHPFPLSNLATAYRGLGRYADAVRVADEAIRLGVATTPTRRLRYQLGVLLGDGGAAAQVEWARSRPREFDIVSAQAQVATFRGQLREARQLYLRAVDMARARSLHGTAAGYLAHLAWTEALYRSPRDASGDVQAWVSRANAASSSPSIVLRFRAPAALGLVGLGREAEAMVAQAQARYPQSTFVRTVLVPTARAAMALPRGRGREARDALEAARDSELGTVAGLIPLYLRAEAFLADGVHADASREYLRILDHSGADPFAPVVPLAHLGLARAARLRGDRAASVRAYEEFLRMWKDADADLHVLRQANAELAQLTATADGAPATTR